MSKAFLEVRDVAVEYEGRTAVEVQRLSVREGETLSLVGHNGSGKSTLLKLVGLLIPPARGQVWFAGAPVNYESRSLLLLRRRMATVLQDPMLCRMSVFSNVALGLRFRGIPAPEIARRTNLWMDRLRIGHVSNRQAATLSGGEAQRTSLARALVLEPELLLLDEPFAALDQPTRNSLLVDLGEILADTGTTTVFATHDRGESLALGDRVAVLFGGRVAQLGSPDEIFTRPATEEVARFVGAETLIPGRVTSCAEGLVRVDIGGPTVEIAGQARVGDPVFVCLRPEDVTLILGADPARTSARNTLEGKVVKILPSDSHVRVVLECGVPVVALVTKPSFRELGLVLGRPIRASFKATAAHLIPRGEGGEGPAI